MSKRLIRLKNKSAFQELSKQLGIEISAVSQNGNTHFGTLTSIDSNHVVVTDPRAHVHQLTLSDLYEIIIDTSATLQNLKVK